MSLTQNNRTEHLPSTKTSDVRRRRRHRKECEFILVGRHGSLAGDGDIVRAASVWVWRLTAESKGGLSRAPIHQRPVPLNPL